MYSSLAYADNIVIMAEGENDIDEIDDSEIEELCKDERIGGKCKKIKDLEIQQGRRKKKEDKLEMEGQNDRRDERI